MVGRFRFPGASGAIMVTMANKKLPWKLIIAVWMFPVLVAGIIFLARSKIITPEVGLLMVVCLIGLYVGIGILVAGHRLVSRLD